jgi:transketolase C-terminal domain/subunit
MNQIELNKIARDFLESRSIDIAKKIRRILADDLEEKIQEMSGPTLHCIHNMALFYTLTGINVMFASDAASEEALSEYFEHTKTLRPKFFAIVESLKDFEPTTGDPKNNESIE